MRIDVLDTKFDNLNMDEALDMACELMERRCGAYVVTPNPEIVLLCRENSEMSRAVEEAPLVIADGVGVIYGAKILGTPLKEKLPGIDFSCGLMRRMAERGQSVFLFGAKPGVADTAAEEIKKLFPGIKIAGTNDGYFTDDGPIVEKINAARPDLLLVCLGAPKQELWMRSHAGSLDAGLMIGAGGSMDVFAGTVQRAPEGWQKAGLEWLYRLIKEPRRIGRMMKLPKFMLLVMARRMRG